MASSRSSGSSSPARAARSSTDRCARDAARRAAAMIAGCPCSRSPPPGGRRRRARADRRELRRLVAGVQRPHRRPWSTATSGSSTSASTSPWSTSGSASAASSAGSTSTCPARDVHHDLPGRRRAACSSRWRCCSGRCGTSTARPSRPGRRDRGPAATARSCASPAVLWLTLLTFLAMFIGYGQMEAGLPGVRPAGRRGLDRVIGFAFAVNTAVIVLLQFAVLRRISGRRRTRVMMVMAGVWAASWLILGAAGLLPDSRRRRVGVLRSWASSRSARPCCSRRCRPSTTTSPPTTTAAATTRSTRRLPGRRDRRAPVAGVLLDRGLTAVYIALMVIGCLGIGVLAFALERRISPEVNGVGDDHGPRRRHLTAAVGARIVGCVTSTSARCGGPTWTCSATSTT